MSHLLLIRSGITIGCKA